MIIKPILLDPDKSRYLKGLVSIEAVDDYIDSLHRTSQQFEDQVEELKEKVERVKEFHFVN